MVLVSCWWICRNAQSKGREGDTGRVGYQWKNPLCYDAVGSDVAQETHHYAKSMAVVTLRVGKRLWDNKSGPASGCRGGGVGTWTTIKARSGDLSAACYPEGGTW